MKVEFSTTIGDISDRCGGRLAVGSPDGIVDTITTDSRDIGVNSFFVPITGERFDGHSFINALVKERDIVGFLTSQEEFLKTAEVEGVSAVFCDNTLRAYGRMAQSHRMEINPTVVGITGTNGKTTTKELLWTILSAKLSCHKNEKNYNNEVGVPYSLLKLKWEHRMAVIELGMNHAGEIERLSEIARPDIALITNVGEGHLEFLGSVENVARAKAEIMHSMKPGSLVIINGDSQCCGLLLEEAKSYKLRVMTYGITSDADITPESYTMTGNSVEIVLRGESFKTELYGLHNVYNLLAALVVAGECGIGQREMRTALENFHPVGMRSEIIEKGFVVINDTYNSNPMSAESALMSASTVFRGRRKIAVLSDMKELGGMSDHYHHELGRQVHENVFDYLYTWGDDAEKIAKGALRAGMTGDNVKHFALKEELMKSLLEFAAESDVILVKGSRSMKMEEVVDFLVH